MGSMKQHQKRKHIGYWSSRESLAIVACTCNYNYSWGWGKWITWTQELKARLGNIVRPVSKNKESSEKQRCTKLIQRNNNRKLPSNKEKDINT